MRKKLATLLLVIMTWAHGVYAMTEQDYINLAKAAASFTRNDDLIEKFLADLEEGVPGAVEFYQKNDITNDIQVLIAMHDNCWEISQRFAAITNPSLLAHNGPATAAAGDDAAGAASGSHYDKENPRISYLMGIFDQLLGQEGTPGSWFVFYDVLYKMPDFQTCPNKFMDAFTLGVQYDYEKKCLSPAVSKEALDALCSVDVFYRSAVQFPGSIMQPYTTIAIRIVDSLKNSLEENNFYPEVEKEISEKIIKILFTGDEWGIDYTRTATPEEFRIILNALSQATYNFKTLDEIGTYYNIGLNSGHEFHQFNPEIKEHNENMFLCAAIKWMDGKAEGWEYEGNKPERMLESFDEITTKLGKDYQETFQQIRLIEAAFDSEDWIMSKDNETKLQTMLLARAHVYSEPELEQ
jgi:hypothetical protein